MTAAEEVVLSDEEPNEVPAKRVYIDEEDDEVAILQQVSTELKKQNKDIRALRNQQSDLAETMTAMMDMLRSIANCVGAPVDGDFVIHHRHSVEPHPNIEEIIQMDDVDQ